MTDYLFLPDTPEGRAIEQIAASLADGVEPGQLATCRKLARVAATAMASLVGPDQASQFFAGVSRDLLAARGQGKGRKRC